MSDAPGTNESQHAPETPALRDRPWFRFLTRPRIVFPLMALGFFLLFPSFGLKELALRHRLPPLECGSELTVSASEDGVLIRSSRRLLSGERVLDHTFPLRRGDYRIKVELACGDAEPGAEVERSIKLDDSAALSFDLSAKCPCRRSR